MPRTSVRPTPSGVDAVPQHDGWADDRPAFAAPLALWVDLTLLNRTGLNQVLERYALPLEVATYFQLRFQSLKVIAVDRALFLVTSVVAPSLRQLFVPHELKLCVTPTLIAGLYDRVLRAQSPIGSLLSQPAEVPSGEVTRFVWEVLNGVVASYEAVAATVPTHALTRKGTEDLRVWTHRVAAFVELIGQQQVFLYNVARAGRKVGVDARAEERAVLDARLERLLRSLAEVRQTASAARTRFDSVDQTTRSSP